MNKETGHMEHKYFDVLDEADDHENYFSPVIRALNRHTSLDHKLLLDVGCGTGKYVFQAFDYCNPKIIGVDGPTSVADRALARGYSEVVEIENLSTDPLPFPQEHFDCVICKDVMEHLVDPKFTLSEIHRVVRVGGTFLFHVPNHFPLSGRLRFLINNRLDTFGYFSPNESRWTFPHIRFFEYSDVVRVLSEHGFDVVEDLSYNFASIPILGRMRGAGRIAHWLAKSFPNQFAQGFTLIAKKKKCLP